MLVFAIALIYFAITLNWGKIAMTKTVVTVASNTAASLVASFMASYGEQVVQTTLGGKRKICGPTQLFQIFLILIIIIVILIIILTGQFELVALVITLIALAALTAAALIQFFYIQPGLTDKWNKQKTDTLSIAGRFLESGIQTALQRAVNDQIIIPDKTDLDVDRVYDKNTTAVVEDYVNRFGFYYQQRLDSAGSEGAPIVNDFARSLRAIIYGDPQVPGSFKMTRSIDCTLAQNHICCPDISWPDKPIPPECNPCCLPYLGGDPRSGDLQSIRPESCGAPLDDLSYPGCLNYPAGGGPAGPYGTQYPYVYEPLYDQYIRTGGQNPPQPISEDQDAYQNFSFLQKLGRDDEHPKFKKRRADPDGWQDPDSADQFRMADAMGYYGWPVYPIKNPADTIIVDPDTGVTMNRTDYQHGIFPFLWKIAEWDWQIDGITNIGATGGANSPECIWCANTGGSGTTCSAAVLDSELKWKVGPLGDPQQHTTGSLNLSQGCAVRTCCTGWHGNAAGGNPENFDPRTTDIVGDIAGIVGTLKADQPDSDVCLVGGFSDVAAASGLWKPGAERFCSQADPATGISTWPYALHCPRQGTCQEKSTFDDGDLETEDVIVNNRDCECNETPWTFTDPEDGEKIEVTVPQAPAPAWQWRDDVLDEIIYGLPEFIDWAENTIFNRTPLELRKQLELWYPSAAEWIEPACPGFSPDDPSTDCPWSFLDEPRGGTLIRFRDNLALFRDRLNAWLTTSNTGPAVDCGVAPPIGTPWCVPPLDTLGNECPEITPGEAATFDSNNNGIRGDPEDVAACLYWNANDETPNLLDADTKRGNADKFQACLDACAGTGDPDQANSCASLPRSLVPGPRPVFVPPAAGTAALLNACLNSTSYAECNTNCANPTFNAAPYNLPVFDPADEARINLLGNARSICEAADFSGIIGVNCGAFGPVLDCASPTLLRSYIDQAICGHLQWIPGNAFFDQLIDLLPSGDPSDGLIPGRCVVGANCDDVEIDLLNRCIADCTDRTNCTQLLSGFNALGQPMTAYLTEPMPLVDAAARAIMNFLDGCKSNCDNNCENIVNQVPNSTGGPVLCSDPKFAHPDIVNCMIENENSCAEFLGFGVGWPINDSSNVPEFHAALLTALGISSTGSCADPNFIDWVTDSKILAENQVVKFRQRAQFLGDRVREAQNMFDIFRQAALVLTNFLGVNEGMPRTFNDASPGRALTLAMLSKPEDAIGDLPYHAIYAWQSDPPKNPMRKAPNQNKGYWHAVRVDVRLPSRCDNVCGAKGGSDPTWPRIKTSTHAIGMWRCYKLVGDRGLVKVQVIRWDEERESEGTFFPIKQLLWKFRFFHPDGADRYGDPDDIYDSVTDTGLCKDFISAAAPGAFMLNQRIPAGQPGANEGCWDLMNGILRAGVMTQTCAQYYYHGGHRKGFNVKFVKCPKLPGVP